MKILVLASQYPYPGFPFSGIFNKRCVEVLSKLCERVEVLSPQPFVPPFFGLISSRWKAYATAVGYEMNNGISVYRPTYLQLPRVGGAFCNDRSAFFFSRRVAKKMHFNNQFDAILSLDLSGSGVMAWRIGEYLGIPSAGWIFGRNPEPASIQNAIGRALKKFDVLFYQSNECFEEAASLLEISSNDMQRDRHIVLAHGIPQPPLLHKEEMRKEIRTALGVTDNDILILSIGRVVRDKGIYELADAISIAGGKDSRIKCVVIGALPAFDESMAVQKILKDTQGLRHRMSVLLSCEPEKVWEYLCAADIFAFTSHHDGMPNSLLEAMAMGVPAIAFGIPPVLEIESGRGGLLTVPPFNATLFSEAIIRLAKSPQERTSIGERGKAKVMDRFMMQKNMPIAVQNLAKMVSAGHPRRC